MRKAKASPAKPPSATRPRAAPSAARRVESVLGCKWSLTVLGLVDRGVHRPGAMEHAVPGLSKKVLNERLRKLVRYGILSRRAYAELPPRVEYRLTTFGRRFARVIDRVEALQRELDADSR
jgi:DNA-binding HxlR family transcriptional regulator